MSRKLGSRPRPAGSPAPCGGWPCQRQQHGPPVQAGNRSHNRHQRCVEPEHHRLHFPRNRRARVCFEQGHAPGLVGLRRSHRIERVETPGDAVQRSLRGVDRDARLQAHQRQKILCIALVKHIVRELRRHRRRCRDGNKQLGRIRRESSIELPGRDSHDGRHLSVHAKSLSHCIWRCIEMVAPEPVGDHHHSRVTGLVELRTQHPPALRRHAEHREIVGRNQLPKEALGLASGVASKADAELHAGFYRSHAGEKVPLLPIALDIEIRRGLFGRHQPAGIRRGGQISEQHRPLRAIYVGCQPDPEPHRQDAHQRESRRLDQPPHRVAQVEAHFGQVLDRQPDGDVRNQPHQPTGPVLPRDLFHRVFAGLQHLRTKGHLEFMRIRPRQPQVDSLRNLHSVTIACFTRIARTSSSRRSHSASSTRLPSAVSRYVNSLHRARRPSPRSGSAQSGPASSTGRLDQPLDRSVERCRPKMHLAGGALQNASCT